MKTRRRFVLGIALAATVAAVPVGAQVFQASGTMTVRIAGLGNTTTVAGDSRIPILTPGVVWDAAQHNLRLTATGHRGAVRSLEIHVGGAQPDTRYEFRSGVDVQLRVHLEDGAQLVAEAGRGFVQITTLDARRVEGAYEGTFAHGNIPVVIRGTFQASLVPPRTRAPGRPGAAR